MTIILKKVLNSYDWRREKGGIAGNRAGRL